MKTLASVKRTTLDVIQVFRSPLDHRRGMLVLGPVRVPCALGRSGTRHDKREGDGATPLGIFRLNGLMRRPDVGPRPFTGLPQRATGRQDGWCDDPADRRYNRPVTLPLTASHERMWRDDHLYDRVIDIAHNRGPIRRGRGSAIFLHLAKPGFSPTEGCVAVRARDMRLLLAKAGPRTRLSIR